jgi:membrane associated rhomboid family serine protease
MELNILTIILIVTVIISLVALNNQEILNRYMFIPYDVKHHKRYGRYVTHMFVHADMGHLAFNMFSLYFLGNFLLTIGPDQVLAGNGVDYGLMYHYGPWNGQLHFFILYFAGGIVATIIPYVRHQDNMHYRSLGASGAVSAVVFAAIFWNPNAQLQLIFLPGLPFPAWLFGLVYLGFEFYMDRKGGGRIAHDAHIGGALFGILYILIINIDKGREFFQAIFG